MIFAWIYLNQSVRRACAYIGCDVASVTMLCTKSAPSYSTQKEIGKYFYGRYFAILFYDLIYNWCFYITFCFKEDPLAIRVASASPANYGVSITQGVHTPVQQKRI